MESGPDGDQTLRDPRMASLPRDIPVQVGDLLARKYRVEHVLGVGGVGVVVAATHIELEERVAIKFLLPAALKQPELVSRFAREARAAVRIKSEHVGRVTDVGTLESGAPYMVMEYLEGHDLGALARQQGPMAIEQAVDYVLQACEAVAEAHTLGIVHRDLKPSNLFVSRRADGSAMVKVLDFGISKVKPRAGSKSDDAAVTLTSSVIGSPLYMSPEQMESTRDVDPRTDVWSLGTILYELVAGACPFDAPTMPQLVAKILRSPPAPLRGYRPDVPPEFEALINRCLEKDPDDRFSNVAELAMALATFAPRRALLSVQRIVRVIQVSGLGAADLQGPPSSSSYAEPPDAERTQALSPAALGETGKEPRRSPRGLVVGAFVAAVALGAGMTLFFVGAPRSAVSPLAVSVTGRVAAVAATVATRASEVVTTPSASPAADAAPAGTSDPAAVTPSALPDAPVAQPARPVSRPRRGDKSKASSEPDVLDER
jgi:serine/threonine-protein kinase